MDIQSWFDPQSLAAKGSGFLGGTFWVLAIGFVCALIGFLAWLLAYRRKFNIKCNILSIREGVSGKYLEDKGAFLTAKDGSKTFKFLKIYKKDLPQPHFRFLIPTKKANVMFWKQLSPDEFVPIDPSEIFGEKNNPAIKTIAPELDFWRIQASERNRSKNLKLAFWQTPLGGMTIILVVGIILFLLWYMTLQSSSTYINKMSEISANYAKTAELLKGQASNALASTAPG